MVRTTLLPVQLLTIGYQYLGFWKDHKDLPGVRQLVLGRKPFDAGEFETITFHDYQQTEDDGHNTVSIGISKVDGRMHISFDLHSSLLRYRVSKGDITSDPETADWSVEAFGETLDYLPGIAEHDQFKEVTYPRFVSLPSDKGELVLELRDGISGLGDCVIYVYRAGQWERAGLYLKGVKNNAYINGIDPDARGGLHISWCYRDFVLPPGATKVKPSHAGPNGPENNHDLYYAYSPTTNEGVGKRWYDSAGKEIGESGISPIVPDTPGVLIRKIPKYHGGLLNQEAQCVDDSGVVHILVRERDDSGPIWYHHHLSSDGWVHRPLPVRPPSYLSSRGKVLYDRSSSRIIFLLPTCPDLVLYSSSSKEAYSDWEQVGKIDKAGCDTPTAERANVMSIEPLYDRYRLELDGVLSIFAGVAIAGEKRREQVIVDLRCTV